MAESCLYFAEGFQFEGHDGERRVDGLQGRGSGRGPEVVVAHTRGLNPQGLDNRLIMGPAADAARPVRRRSRLGGLLDYYERAA